MITRAPEVYALLLSAADSVPVFYSYPSTFTTFPAIAWRESGNRLYRQTDAREYLAELIYTVDIWSAAPEENAEIAAALDETLNKNGYARVFCEDLYENEIRLHHRSMRYRVIADAAGNNYQG